MIIMSTIFDKTSTANSDSNSVLFQTLLEHERKLQELENQNSAFENTNKYLRDEILDLQWTCLQFRYITEKFEKYPYDPDDVLEKQRKNNELEDDIRILHKKFSLLKTQNRVASVFSITLCIIILAIFLWK